MRRGPLHGGPCLARLDLLPILAYKMAAMGMLMGEGLSSQVSPGSRGSSFYSGPLYIPMVGLYIRADSLQVFQRGIYVYTWLECNLGLSKCHIALGLFVEHVWKMSIIFRIDPVQIIIFNSCIKFFKNANFIVYTVIRKCFLTVHSINKKFYCRFLEICYKIKKKQTHGILLREW